MTYSSPGKADALPKLLLEAWNDTIQKAYETQHSSLKSRFFALDYKSLKNPNTARIQWFGDPAEPVFCLDSQWGQKLSDWGIRGRHSLHNEYCEYHVTYRMDDNGVIRPKRVEVSTELREYWLTIAIHDPIYLQKMCDDVLGFTPDFKDLYGVSDPKTLSPEQRKLRFSTLVAGNGRDGTLPADVPNQPTGKLNRDNILFMTHPINGLDDLLYIVMFGAHPYATVIDGEKIPASKEQIFRAHRVEHLACRHADPAAAMGAHDAAMEGRTVALDDPLGMYIRTFNQSDFIYKGNPLPAEWIKLSRGEKTGLYQRLVIGPPDSEDIFLDDIDVLTGASKASLKGGFQVTQKIEVGPIVLAGDKTEIKDSEYKLLNSSDELIDCAEAGVCSGIINPLKKQYEMEHGGESPLLIRPV